MSYVPVSLEKATAMNEKPTITPLDVARFLDDDIEIHRRMGSGSLPAVVGVMAWR